MSKLLEKMRRNPRDWQIGQVETLCRRHGLICTAPSGGSHYAVRADETAWAKGVTVRLTIPAHKPIKPVYIRQLVALVDEVDRLEGEG